MGRIEDEMAEYVGSSSKVGRIEDEVVAVDKKTDSREGSRLDASIPVQNLALTL